MAILIFGVVVIGVVLNSFVAPLFDFIPPGIFLSLALVATAVITFFGFLWRGNGNPPVGEEDMRIAITVSIVTVYLVLIGLVAFLPEQPNQGQMPAITSTMLTSFTALVAIVVPFYFGVSGYTRIQLERIKVARERSETADEQDAA
jgi:hypothetical protein